MLNKSVKIIIGNTKILNRYATNIPTNASINLSEFSLFDLFIVQAFVFYPLISLADLVYLASYYLKIQLLFYYRDELNY